MPPSRRSRRQRLPKSERRAPGLKNVVDAPSTTQLQSSIQLLTLASYHPPISSPSTTPTQAGSGGHAILPALPDDVWLKIITRAGTRATFSCLTVSKQLSDVARTVLASIRLLDISRHFSENLVPSTAAVLAVLSALPRLETISLTKWRFTDSFPDIANVISCYFSSTTLRSVTFSGVEVAPAALRQLFERCPSIKKLRIGNHTSIDDKLCKSLASTCEPFRLTSLDIHDTSTVSRSGISALLKIPTAVQLFLTAVQPLDAIFHDESARRLQHSGRTLHAKKCPTLHTVQVSAKLGTKVDDINISMSRALMNVILLAPRQTALSQSPDLGLEIGANYDFNAFFPITRITLSNCPTLRDVWLRPNEHVPADIEDLEDGETPAQTCALPFLEELNLFGARSLSQRTFAFTFGLSHSGAVKMPLLRSLNLNGTSIEHAVLDGYTCLEVVDFSGSAVRTLVIQNCWNLRRVMLQGRSIPFTRVHLTLSTACDVIGSRSNWNWERYNSCQTISFG